MTRSDLFLCNAPHNNQLRDFTPVAWLRSFALPVEKLVVNLCCRWTHASWSRPGGATGITESQTQRCPVLLHWTCSCNNVHLPKNLLSRRLSKYIRMIQNDTTLRSFIDKGRSPGASWVSFCHLFFIVESWEVSQKIICLDMLNQLKNHCVPLVTWFGDVRCLSPCDSDPSRLVPFFCCKRPATSSLK